jgi:predicted Abi (CAAX) family protease
MGHRRAYRHWLLLGLAVVTLAFTRWSGISFPMPNAQGTVPEAAFAELANYPADQEPGDNYLPVADWVGRLILPDQSAAEADPQDWVWIEVYQSPRESLVGQRLRLQWQSAPELQTYINTVTRGIEFDAAAIASIADGIVHPERLNGWSKVGPLQSLAGTRPEDSVIVALSSVQIVESSLDESPALAIGAVPVQVPERFYGLVNVIEPDPAQPAPQICPGASTCPSDYFRVRHYNPGSQEFDGPLEIIRIPQVPANPNGIFQSTSRELANSPAAEAGWYVYGARNQDGLFVVNAIVPRRLFQLHPQEIITQKGEALNYINFANWRDTPERKGTIQSVLLDVDTNSTQSSPEAGDASWQEGDQAVVLHLFGGIGGEKAEPRSVPGTVTGHFAFGTATIARDPFTQELRLFIIYDQVYSHNPLGIVAGKTTWAAYTGSLQRGWLGVRPISDVVIKLPALTRTYTFGDITLNPFAEFQKELAIMMARYRTGDGTGASIVTPAQSCMQDSSQALYETILQLRTQVGSSPAIQQWLKNHPDDLQTQQFQELMSLGQSLARVLVPLGIVRPDWHENSEVLRGIRTADQLGNKTNFVTSLLSWRTVIPRVAYDNIAVIFLEHQAEMWFLRTNQVGGQDPTMLPLAPTALFGEYVVIPTLFSRLIESLKLPNWQDVFIGVLGLLVYGLIAKALDNLLQKERGTRETPHSLTAAPSPQRAIRVFFAPLLLEELIFRVIVLPHPTEGVLPITRLLWSLVSLGLFCAYRLVLWKRRGRNREINSGFTAQPRPFFQALILGMVAIIVYLSTGSLLVVAGFRWGAWWWQALNPAQKPTSQTASKS